MWLLLGNSLLIQWLGFHTFTAQGQGSIPDQETKIPQAMQPKKKKVKKKMGRGRIKH